MASGKPQAAPGAAPAARRSRAAAPQSLALWLAGMLRPRHSAVPLEQLALPLGRGMTKGAVRALATGVPMRDALLCRALGRYKMLLDPADQGFAPHLVLDGYWEWWTTAFLARHLRPGQRVAEIGAGYGYFTLLMADLIGARGGLTAFEPNPGAADLLQRNLELNGFAGRVRVERAAIGAVEDAAPLFVPAAAPLAARTEAETEAGTDRAVLRVPQRPLDSLAEEPLDWIKIDLPGSTEAVWSGMQRLLDRQPGVRLLMGFDPARAAAPASLVEQMARRFPLRVLDEEGGLHSAGPSALLEGGVRLLYLARET